MLYRRMFFFLTGPSFLNLHKLISSIDDSHVTQALKLLMKNVQTHEDLDVDENELEDLVCFTFLSG